MNNTDHYTDSSSKKNKQGLKSWLKIHMETEVYQPPHNGLILLQILVGLLFFILVIRFWYLQVHRGAEFSKQAQENRLRQERIFAPRGRILDTKGNILAENRTAFGLNLIREDCQDIPSTLAQISSWSHIPLNHILNKYRQDRIKMKSFEPLLLITDIDFDMLARIESELYAWPGLEIMVRTKRNYPERDLFAHILGYVAETNEDEMKKDPTLAMGDLIGKQGLELVLEKTLRGQKGSYEIEVDALSRILGKKLHQEPHAGREIHLTIDKDLQQAAWDAMNGEAGCIVIMEPDTGKLRALVTSPAYDNNLFAAGISKKNWEALRDSKRFPLMNRVIQSTYPPGSVWKLIMAALFLENGIKPSETVFCPGYAKLGNQIFRCWKKTGHGSMNMESSLIHSCDVYYYLMADRLGIDKIERFAKACGFGKKTGIDLPNERSGLVPSREWKKRKDGSAWSRGNTFNVSIGQGDMLVTPVQIAVYVSALLNGGKILKPQLIDNIDPTVINQLPASQQTINFVVNAMRRTAANGTAHVVSRKDADMGGKTGTAQVVKLKTTADDRRVRNADLEYSQRDHAWIATWGIKNNKKYVVIVMIEHGGGGSSVAGPVAKKIYNYLFGQETAQNTVTKTQQAPRTE